MPWDIVSAQTVNLTVTQQKNLVFQPISIFSFFFLIGTDPFFDLLRESDLLRSPSSWTLSLSTFIPKMYEKFKYRDLNLFLSLNCVVYQSLSRHFLARGKDHDSRLRLNRDSRFHQSFLRILDLVVTADPIPSLDEILNLHFSGIHSLNFSSFKLFFENFCLQWSRAFLNFLPSIWRWIWISSFLTDLPVNLQ